MPSTGEIYHIINRGIEGRIIFNNKRDYERFLLTISECNDSTPSPDNKHRHRRIKKQNPNQQSLTHDKTKPLVEILCFSLMPNHFHLAVKQLTDEGIAKFMQRIGNSYTKYFNIKNNRKGSLFMSRYKKVHIKTNSQIRHLVTYIHANPLDLISPEWRLGKLKNFEEAKEYLENYKWSSYPVYTNIKNEMSDFILPIIKKDIINDFYSNPEDYFEAITSWSNRVVNIQC